MVRFSVKSTFNFVRNRLQFVILTPVERLRCGVSEGGLAAVVTDVELTRTCDMVGAAGVRIAVDFVTGKGCGG